MSWSGLLEWNTLSPCGVGGREEDLEIALTINMFSRNLGSLDLEISRSACKCSSKRTYGRFPIANRSSFLSCGVEIATPSGSGGVGAVVSGKPIFQASDVDLSLTSMPLLDS